MATQYSGSAKAGSFAPDKTLTLSQGSKENDERILSTLSDYNRIQQSNDRTIEDNARKGERGWEALAKFSSSLTDTLVKRQQQKNDEEYEAGIADAYLNGIPQEESDAFDESEAEVEVAGQATDDLAVEYEQATNDGAGSRQISESTGWRALGRARGTAQQAGSQYGIYMAQFAQDLNAITDPQQYAERLKEIRMDYLKQFGGMSRGLMAKYMFPKMQEWENRSFLDWQAANNELIAQNQLDEDLTQFYADVDSGNGGAAFEAFIRKHEKRLGGRGKARDLLFQNIEEGVKNGQITMADVTAFGDQMITKDGKRVSIKNAFGKQFADLQQRLQDRRFNEYDREEKERQIAAGEILRDLRERQAQLGRNFTEEEKRLIEENWDVRLGPIPQEITNLSTVEGAEEDVRIEAIEAKIRAGLPILEEDLAGLSARARDNYNRYLNTRGRQELLSGAKSWATSLAGDISQENVGEKDKSEKFRNLESNINQQLAIEYNRQLKIVGDPQQALNNAKSIVSEKFNAMGYDNGAKITITDSAAAAQAIATTQATLRDNPEAFRTTVLNQDAVDQLITQIEADNGKPTTRVPMYFTAIAAGMHNIDAFDLANQQLQLSGHPGLVKPEIEQQIDQIPEAEIKDLLRFRPSPSRTVRAAVLTSASGSGAEFLDLVASEESSGDYNAFNLGGSNDGHTAHGSGYGDAATQRWGTQLTQMTVGEVMELGSSPSSENRWIWAAGRYQIIPDTLRGLVRNHGIDTNALFDEAMQDQLALYLAYARLASGQGFKGLRNEWIGLNNVSNQEIADSLGGGFNNPHLLLPGV